MVKKYKMRNNILAAILASILSGCISTAQPFAEKFQDLCLLLESAKSAPKCRNERDGCAFEKQGFRVSYNQYGIASLTSIDGEYFQTLFGTKGETDLRKIAQKIEAKNPKLFRDVFEVYNKETDSQEHISIDNFVKCREHPYYLHVYKNDKNGVIYEIDATAFWW